MLLLFYKFDQRTQECAISLKIEGTNYNPRGNKGGLHKTEMA